MSQPSVMGQPTRTAAQDANEGIINPPSTKYEARQSANVEKNLSSVSKGVLMMGESLGAAFTELLSQEATDINERRVVAAKARQGEQTAINDVDEANKRTGWRKGLFGQSIEYRVAQQQAAKNGVTDTYLQGLEAVDSNAHLSPKQYREKLIGILDENLKKYKGDPDTQNLVKSQWINHVPKLAERHKAAHDGYTQIQARTETQRAIEQTFDAANLESQAITSPRDAQAVQEGVSRIFDKSLKHPAQDDIAYRSTVNEVIQKNLRQGNVGAYNAAKMNGWFDSNTEKEQITLDRALSDYDTHFKGQVDNLWAEAELQAYENKTYEGMLSIYENLRSNLDALSKRSSGSPKAETALTKTELKASKGIQDVYKNRETVNEQLDKFFEEGMERTRKEEAKAAQLTDLKEAVNTTNSIDRAGKLSNLGASDKEQGEALDLVLLDDITRLTGKPETITPLEAIQTILGDTNIAKQVQLKAKGKQIKSPMIKQAVTTVINGLNGLVDETGKLNEVGKQAFTSISVLEQDEDNFINTVGTETYDKLQIIKSGLPKGATIDMVQKHLDKYAANKGTREQIGSRWELNEGESKQSRISKIYNNVTDKYPTSQTVAHYMKTYDRGLIIFDEDHDRAQDYVVRTIKNEGVQYNGMVIQNGKAVTQGLEYSLPDLLDFAQMEVKGVSPLTTHLKTLGAVDDKEKAVTRLDQIPGLYFTVIGNELYIDSDTAQSEVVIRRNDLEEWSKGLKEKNRTDQMRREADDKSFMEYIKLKQQMGDYLPKI